MILSSLFLSHFRSYKKRAINFHPSLTIIVGPNAIGKTNILEAIMMCAVGKSFRADREQEVISFGEELTRIKAEGIFGDDAEKLEILVTRGIVSGQKAPMKKFLVNGVPRRLLDFAGHVKAVRFWPQDLELITDGPSIRRKYLDSVLVQVDREYRRNLMSYERGLRQRNKLLFIISEGKAQRNQLLFWNQLLVKAGGYVTDARAAFLQYVNEHQIQSVDHKTIYDKSVISESRLEQYAMEEVASHATLVGPHRDDFEVAISYQPSALSKDVHAYGSRGEQRLAVLWMKLAELSFVHEKTRDRPILLLDDIFSELDSEHRELVLSLIDHQQTVITSAEEDIMDIVGKRECEVIRLENR
ncbi:DNA replication and repair protein RecF [Candidatus Gottesmanbacteria bacterium]|nr:DNA replication and repair protein RecF [Candidatus Gottesmanbacteria bacterium]